MSTIKSSNEHLTLNADGASKDIKFQANGVEKASISSAGAFTSTTIDATVLTGALPAISGAALTGVGVAGITSSADATAITINSSEQVGIGTASPTSMLHIESALGNSSPPPMLYIKNSNGPAEIKLQAGGDSWTLDTDYDADNLIIRGSGTEIINFKQDGRGLSSFTAKAWGKFSQSGSHSFSASHNCSSISDAGTGESQINYTNALDNADYAVVSGHAAEADWAENFASIAETTTYCKFLNITDGATKHDTTRGHFAVFEG